MSGTPNMVTLGLVVVMAVIVPVIVLLVLGLSNRHTRGATKGVAIAIGVIVGLMFLWRMAAVPGFETTVSNPSASETQRQVLHEQIVHFDQMAANLEGPENSEVNRQMASACRAKAESLRAQLLGHQDTKASLVQDPDVTLGLAVSPVVLLVFAVILFLLFKHAGPAIGFAALAIPVVLLFVGYSSFRVQEGDARQLAQARLEMLGQQFREQHGDTIVAAPAEHVVEHDEAVPHDEIEVPESETVDESHDAEAAQSPLPDWVKQPPKSVPNVYRRVVESSWLPTSEECRVAVDPRIEQAVVAYLQRQVMAEGGGPVPSLDELHISDDFIREHLVADEYYQTRDFEHEEGLTNLHVLLEIDSADSDSMLGQWRSHARISRIEWVRNLMLGVMFSLAGVLGLIKLDTATKGYYTKRLFIGVPAAIIGIGLFLALLR